MADGADPAIVVRGLTKRFPVPRGLREALLAPFSRRWTTALAGVDVEVPRGEVFGLLGPNGAGKTTLLRILGTLLLPTEGRVLVEGHDVVLEAATVRRKVGFCLDTERTFYFRLTGEQNLAFFATLNNVPAERVARRVGEVLETVGLDGYGGKPFRNYSKGMQQRLGLARALLTDPSVLLLDEPTRSLDPAAAAEFRAFLRGTLAAGLGKTIVLVTHSLEEARECCDRVGVMEQGRLVFQGAWEEARRLIRAGDEAPQAARDVR